MANPWEQYQQESPVDPRARSIQLLEANTQLSPVEKKLAMGEIDKQYPTGPWDAYRTAGGPEGGTNKSLPISRPDIIGRLKAYATAEPKPGDRSMFGEPEILKPVSDVIRGAGEMLMPESLGDLGQQLALSTGVGAAVKYGGPLLSKIFPRSVNKIAEILGRPTSSVGRELQGTKEITAAYRAAEKITTDVPTGNVFRSVYDTITNPAFDEKAGDALQKIITDAGIGKGATVPYNKLVAAEQQVTNLARKSFERKPVFDKATTAALFDVRKTIVSATKTVDSALADANAYTGHYHASEEVLRIVNHASSAKAARAAVENAFSKKPWLVEQLGLDDPSRLQILSSALDKGVRGDVAKKILYGIGAAGVTGAVYKLTGSHRGFGGSE